MLQQEQFLPTHVGLITMRKAQTADFASVLEILDDAARWILAKGFNQWQPGQFHKTVTRGDTYLALLDGQPIGTIAIWWNDHLDMHLWSHIAEVEDAGYIHRLALHQAFVGQGIGRILLQWAEARIADAGRHYMRLDCMAENPILCQYYERMGFIYRGEVHHAAKGPGWRGRLYEKKIVNG